MLSLKNLSINAKLSLLVTVAAAVAMLLSCAAFAVNDYLMIRTAKLRQLSALAGVLGDNSTAALSFQDPGVGKEILSSLQMQPTIRIASLYDVDGRLLATYRAKPGVGSPPPSPEALGSHYADDNSLCLTQPIVEDGARLGTIYLSADMSDLYEQLFQYINIVSVVMIVSLGGAILLSSRLQRIISLPIVRLAATAQQISAEGDYSIRVCKEADDELGTLYDAFNRMLDRIQLGKEELQEAHDELELRVQQRTRQLSLANRELSREIGERKRTEGELEHTHQKLIGAARQAGMAEIATGVLHNVGNVLNSVNVSSTIARDRLRNSRLADLVRAVDLLGEHQEDLARFLTEDEKGQLLPSFLAMLAEHLCQEQESVLEELQSLTKNVDHIKTIVSTQQSYAGAAGMVELVSLVDLIEDALKIKQSALDKYAIEVIRDFENLPAVHVEKQKLLQILINLMTNAKDSLVESPIADKQLTVRILRPTEDRVRIEVSDNGVGIANDELTRIFSHGFTTKHDGHGFGLHASANAAREIGGCLSAGSEGPDRGATFIVELPFHAVDADVVASPAR